MVLDWLVDVHKIEGKPWKMIFFGFIYSVIAAGLALMMLPKFASPVMLAFTMVAFVPLMISLMKEEELRDEGRKNKLAHWLVKEHWPAMKFFICMFAGMLLAYIVLFILLPTQHATNLFSMQLDIITSRNVQLGALIGDGKLLAILANNFKVLAIGLFLAFIYGTGAIFILSWNAAILGTLIGDIVKTAITTGTVPLAIGKYLLHGIPEIIAYFIAGLAGGIISIAVAKHKLGDPQFKEVVKDSLELILLSVVLLIFAGLLEVYASPLIG
jgi:uncharacterized membrane protein SpoIIM required for sporulation